MAYTLITTILHTNPVEELQEGSEEYKSKGCNGSEVQGGSLCHPFSGSDCTGAFSPGPPPIIILTHSVLFSSVGGPLGGLRSRTPFLMTTLTTLWRMYASGSRSRSSSFRMGVVMRSNLANVGSPKLDMLSKLSESGMRFSVALEPIVSKRCFSGQVCPFLFCGFQVFWAETKCLGLSPFLTTLEVFTNPSRIARLLLAMRQFATFDVEQLWYGLNNWYPTP